MDSATERFPEQYKKNGERAVWMYQRRHPSSGASFAPAHMSQGQFGPYFHASDHDFKPGDEITSPASRGERITNQPTQGASEQDLEGRAHRVYAGFNTHAIDQFGRNKYEVEPTGHVHPDPEAPEMAVTSYSSMRVLRKVGGD